MNPRPLAAAPLNEVLDRDCVQRMSRGEMEALRLFYTRHANRVFGFSRRMLGDVSEAEEATQDVFVRAWRKAAAYDPLRASPWAWLAMMTRSICLDRLRRRERREIRAPIVAGVAAGDGAEAGGIEQVAGAAPEARGAGIDVSALLARLRPIERTCLSHVFFDGLTHAETAARTGLPLGSVKSHVRRALQRLRESLSPHDS